MIPKDRFLTNYSYYQKLLTLCELANMSPEVIAERIDETAPEPKTPDQIRLDIMRLKNTIDEGRLPEEHTNEFHTIIGMRNQLENNPNPTVSATFTWDTLSEDQRQAVDHRVGSSLYTDQELGCPTDEATKWFYRRLYTGRLVRESP